jgi:hypothetical protein
MNGAHDMGGAHGFGPVVQEENEPIFHADWEAKALVMTLSASGGRWNIDMSRFARENSSPADYLARSYYEIWTYGLEKLMVESGMVTSEELAAARDGAHFEPVETPTFGPEKVELCALAVRHALTRMSLLASQWANVFALPSTHHPPTPAVRSMCVAESVLSIETMASSCFPTPTHMAVGQSPNTSMRCGSKLLSCGGAPVRVEPCT